MDLGTWEKRERGNERWKAVGRGRGREGGVKYEKEIVE